MRHFPRALSLSLVLAVGCAEVHGLEASDAGASADAHAALADAPLARGDAGRSCELRPATSAPWNVVLVLEPASDNPASCRAAAPCEVWFGHGRHLRCPPWDAPATPLEAACSLGLYDEATDTYDACLCADGAGFVADFATGEVLDRREGLECRYRIVYE